MLTSTFLHIPGIDERAEKSLWQSKIRTWDDFLSASPGIRMLERAKEDILLSKKSFEQGNHGFFSSRLLSRYHWRAYPEFKDRCCFLDIETTGLDRHRDIITVIGIYDGKESKSFISGINLEKFKEEIKKFSFIVTFNGAMFDLPFIKAKFPDVELNQLHVDLRWAMRMLGYTGGLKKIEHSLDISRGEYEGITGLDAVRLWHTYKRKDDKNALDALINYNIHDIENLKSLMEFSYERLEKLTWQNF